MAESLGPRKPTVKKRHLALLLPPLLVAVALIGVLIVSSRPGSSQELDQDLCALDSDESNAQTVFLLDLRKPLDQSHRSLLGEVLREVSLGMGTNAELRVFALSPDSQAPRLSIDRLCKPYANADLQIGTAKDQRDSLRDCDDLPAQLPASLREAAGRFCDRRQSLQNRVIALARNQPSTPLTNSYLIEALEDTVIELSSGSGPRKIHLFSDMMQHSHWYSHLDLEWTDWNSEDFDQTRDALTARMGRRPPVSDLTVHIDYMPLVDRTDHPRPKRAHQAFWEAYFDNARLTFHEQSPLPAYAAEPLMDRLTPEEIAAQERELIEQERREAARMLAEVRKAREELDAEWQRVAEERARMTAPPKARPQGAAEPRSQQQSLADQGEELAERNNTERQNVADDRARTTVPPKARPQRAEEPRSRQQSLADQGEELAARPAETDEAGTREAAEAEATPQVAERQTAIETIEGITIAIGQTTIETDEGNAGAGQQTDSESVEPAEPVSAGRSEADGQLALASDRLPAAALPPCNATLLPRFLSDAATDIYPGRRRMNYGSATITVRYMLDQEGATIDDEIEVVGDESSVERPRSYDLFAQTAKQVVRNWVYEFEDEAACSKRQERVTKFQFQYD